MKAAWTGSGFSGRAQALDGRDLAAGDRADGRGARAHRLAVEVHGAGAALGEAAPELRPRQSEVVPEDVEQGCRGIVDLDVPRRAVDLNRHRRHRLSSRACRIPPSAVVYRRVSPSPRGAVKRPLPYAEDGRRRTRALLVGSDATTDGLRRRPPTLPGRHRARVPRRGRRLAHVDPRRGGGRPLRGARDPGSAGGPSRRGRGAGARGGRAADRCSARADRAEPRHHARAQHRGRRRPAPPGRQRGDDRPRVHVGGGAVAREVPRRRGGAPGRAARGGPDRGRMPSSPGWTSGPGRSCSAPSSGRTASGSTSSASGRSAGAGTSRSWWMPSSSSGRCRSTWRHARSTTSRAPATSGSPRRPASASSTRARASRSASGPP